MASVDWSLYAGAEQVAAPRPERYSGRIGRGKDLAASVASDSDTTTSDQECETPATPPSDWEEREERGAHGAKSLTSTSDPPDFLWSMTEEPHRTRRRQLLRQHPEIVKLFGHEPWTKYIVLGVLALHLSTPFVLALLQPGIKPLSWAFVGTAYLLGGTLTQNLFLAIHEITHNLAFKSIWANKTLACIANLGIGIPYAMLFKDYHIEHHKFLGVDGIDTDLPTRFEMLCLQNVLGKTFFCTFQILFYALRPGFVRAQKLTKWHLINIGSIIAFDLGLYYLPHYLNLLVPGSPGLAALARQASLPLIYLIMSAFFAGSLHPCAAHFIAEHYVFDGMRGDEPDAQETWSYYGSLNMLTWNVGYHQEHHDFCKLPKLHKIAQSTYGALPSHTSWPMVTLKFILDPRVGLHARVKRRSIDPSKET